jgi:hypothetical protein
MPTPYKQLTEMPPPALPSLNQGQQAAADGFFQFLFSPEKEIIISGPGGVGKTFLMGWLIDQVMPEYFKACKMMGIEVEYDSVVMTATTNKASEVLGLSTKRPTETIHSFLALKVTDDYATGRSKLTKTNNWQVHERKIIFVDEAYMTDTQLLTLLREGTHKCKIVFVGDHCQLSPVMEPISPIHRAGLSFFELTENVRNAGQPALMSVCQQLRNTVETGEFLPIKTVPGVIDHVDDAEMEQLIASTFHTQTRDARILAYTNKRVVEYNDHIRQLRGLSGEYGVGELLVNSQAIRLSNQMLSVEEEVEIIDQQGKTEKVEVDAGDQTTNQKVTLEIRSSTLRSRLGCVYWNVPLPVDRDHFAALLRYYQQRKNWNRYFFMKNKFPDLRPRDAATVHKAQGSTYDVVFLDVGDISSCHQPTTAARLLYVAFTRARNRVILYGKLSEKYGGVVT